MTNLNTYLARELADDSVRDARRRRTVHAAVTGAQVDHAAQRRLVQASLLLSRRQDLPTHRRWA